MRKKWLKQNYKIVFKFYEYPSAIFLVLANLMPLLGVLFWKWDLFLVLIIYWMESVVIGIFNIFRMLKVGAEEKYGNVAFFLAHYGLFMAGHLLFLVKIFAPRDARHQMQYWDLEFFSEIRWALLALVLSHGFSYFFNFLGHKEYEVIRNKPVIGATSNGRPTKDPSMHLLFLPYVRVFLMQFTIIIGGMLAQAFGKPVIALGILVVLKIAADLLAHLNEHVVYELPAAKARVRVKA